MNKFRKVLTFASPAILSILFMFPAFAQTNTTTFQDSSQQNVTVGNGNRTFQQTFQDTTTFRSNSNGDTGTFQSNGQYSRTFGDRNVTFQCTEQSIFNHQNNGSVNDLNIPRGFETGFIVEDFNEILQRQIQNSVNVPNNLRYCLLIHH